uniref:Uncharacterized protein n=1 Tax=Strigamia maritima TaxID=126957 RepID=T1IMP3_STRMM
MKEKTIAFLAIYCVLIFIFVNAGDRMSECLHCANDDKSKCCWAPNGLPLAYACTDKGHCHPKLGLLECAHCEKDDPKLCCLILKGRTKDNVCTNLG